MVEKTVMNVGDGDGCGEHLLEEHKLKASEENKEKPGEGHGHLFSSS